MSIYSKIETIFSRSLERYNPSHQSLLQKIICKKIESHYNNILIGHQAELLRIIVIGIAGTGKTYLIKTIRG